MKPFFLFLSMLVMLCTSTVKAQQSLILTYTAINSTYYAELDSIKVINLTNNRDTMLYWNDTILMLNMNVGLAEQGANNGFDIEAFPNPVTETAVIKAVVPEAGNIYVKISDLKGRNIFSDNFKVRAGVHDFSFISGKEAVYFISFSLEGRTDQVKLINSNPRNGQEVKLTYRGLHHSAIQKSTAEYLPFQFSLGDELLYIGYFDEIESSITDVPLESADYTFQFASNIPCIGTPTVNYEGQTYNTVQILSQCWLKENLNVGTMIPAGQQMKDNNLIEKYCYKNEADSCTKYGGLYQWDEVMQYSSQQGTQGICPPGWHIPDESEWKVLEGSTDSQYNAGAPIWNITGYRGFDAGKQLKSNIGWRFNGNGTDTFGFIARPGGYLQPNASFDYVGNGSYWWLSVEQSSTEAWYRDLRYNQDNVYRGSNEKEYGFSVRCLKD